MGLSPRVAVLHGQRRITTFLALELTKFGFSVDCAENTDEAFTLVRTAGPQAVVLDPKIPGLESIAFLRLLRLYTHAPIVMLGVDIESSEQLAYFEHGADYCVSLPADIAEIVAILQSAMRRSALRDPETHCVADLEVNLRQRTAVRAGRTLALTRREFDVLAALAREPNRVFGRRELLAIAWGDGSQATGRAVDTCVLGIRRKLDAPFRAAMLHTVRGVGFTLRPPAVT